MKNSKQQRDISEQISERELGSNIWNNYWWYQTWIGVCRRSDQRSPVKKNEDLILNRTSECSQSSQANIENVINCTRCSGIKIYDECRCWKETIHELLVNLIRIISKVLANALLILLSILMRLSDISFWLSCHIILEIHILMELSCFHYMDIYTSNFFFRIWYVVRRTRVN